MAIINPPTPFRIKSIKWNDDRPASLNQSVYDGSTTVAAQPWYGRRTASVTMAPIITEQNFLAIKAFLKALRGQVNTFRLPVTEGSQKDLPSATVQAIAHQGDVSMIVAGCFLQPGHEVTVNDQPLTVISSAPSGANCSITFEPPLRADAAAGTAIEVAAPTCLVRLASSTVSWSVDPGQLYSCSFDVQEAY